MIDIKTHSNYEIIPVHEATRVRFYTSIDKGSYVPPHWHDALEIVYLQEGDLTFTISNNTMPITPGQCILVNPNVIHSTRCLYSNRAIVFQIPLSFIETCLPDAQQIAWELSDPDTKKQLEIDKIKGMLLEMQSLDDNKPDGGMLRFNSLLFEVMFMLYNTFALHIHQGGSDRRGYELSRLVPVLSYADKNYNRPISIEEISNIAGFQPNYFCRFFKKCMGVTFLEYQNELRLSHIYRDLLYLEVDTNISSILEQHGFTNYKVFRRMFYNRFQATPSEIRKQRKNGTHDLLSEKIVL